MVLDSVNKVTYPLNYYYDIESQLKISLSHFSHDSWLLILDQFRILIKILSELMF
jgi:hypothetical protein